MNIRKTYLGVIIAMLFFILLMAGEVGEEKKVPDTYKENTCSTGDKLVGIQTELIEQNLENKPHKPDTSLNATGDTKKEEPVVEPTYTKDELDLLSRLINAEAGSSWISDEQQQLVGMVALNRVKSNKYPNTLKEVIYQKGQYACTWNGAFEKDVRKRPLENAKLVLSGKVECPDNVVYQAEFKQGGGVYKKFYDKVLNTTTYICYAGK